jgi:hypothetical protein
MLRKPEKADRKKALPTLGSARFAQTEEIKN